jgi:hypothetical protein
MAGTKPGHDEGAAQRAQPARAGKFLSAIFHFFIDLID